MEEVFSLQGNEIIVDSVHYLVIGLITKIFKKPKLLIKSAVLAAC